MSLIHDQFSKCLKSNLWFSQYRKAGKIWKKYLGINAWMNFFEPKIFSFSLTHYLIRANLVSNFSLLIFCHRLWVTFDWSAALLFSKCLFLIGCLGWIKQLPTIGDTAWVTHFNFFSTLMTSDKIGNNLSQPTKCPLNAEFFIGAIY